MWITWLKSPLWFFSSLGGLKSLCRWYFSHSDLAVSSTLSVPVASEFCVRNLFSPFHFLLASSLIPARDLLGLTASCLRCLCHYTPGTSPVSPLVWGVTAVVLGSVGELMPLGTNFYLWGLELIKHTSVHWPSYGQTFYALLQKSQ